jgi:uncharacterized protein with GYD domain
MSKYLTVSSYTAEGIKGLLKEGGTARREAIQKLVESLGGRLEAFYFAFGENDLYCLIDVPDNVSMAAATLTVMPTGGSRGFKTVVLLTPEEIDQAVKTPIDYRPPG